MYIQTQAKTEHKLSQVYEGMEVFDNKDNRVGTVSTVHFAERLNESADTMKMVNAIEDAIGYRTDLPMPVYARLYEEGFVLVNQGFLERDVILVPNQIDEILADSIFLSVEQAALREV